MEIKRLRDSGMTYREIASRYGVSIQRIAQIVTAVEERLTRERRSHER